MDKRHGEGDMKYMDGTVYEVKRTIILFKDCHVEFCHL